MINAAFSTTDSAPFRKHENPTNKKATKRFYSSITKMTRLPKQPTIEAAYFTAYGGLTRSVPSLLKLSGGCAGLAPRQTGGDD
jgi:hypothetical protein